MPTIDTTPDRLGTLIRLGEEDRQRKISGAVLEAAYAGLELLAQSAPKDLGLLRQSGHVVRTADGGAEIDFDAPHSGVVEMGSRPHMPPVAPLEEWVLRHLDFFGGATEKDAKGIAWAIAKKIEREGTQPTHFVRNHLPELAAILDAILAARVG